MRSNHVGQVIQKRHTEHLYTKAKKNDVLRGKVVFEIVKKEFVNPER